MLLNLPLELIVHIFSYLYPIDLLVMRLVSSYALNCIDTNMVWEQYISYNENINTFSKGNSWTVCKTAMYTIKMFERASKRFHTPGLSCLKELKEHDPQWIYNQLIHKDDTDIIMVYTYPVEITVMFWWEEKNNEEGYIYRFDMSTIVCADDIKSIEHIIYYLQEGYHYYSGVDNNLDIDDDSVLNDELYKMGFYMIE
jgi:hypothetical protein